MQEIVNSKPEIWNIQYPCKTWNLGKKFQRLKELAETPTVAWSDLIIKHTLR